VQEWGAEDLVDVVELLTSELVTNMLRSAVTPFRIDILLTPTFAQVRVHVEGEQPDEAVDATDRAASFGAQLMRVLAGAPGSAVSGLGTDRWFIVGRDDGPPGRAPAS
jgi:hypothetical protein